MAHIDRIEQGMKTLEALYPDLCKRRLLGKGADGSKIHYLEITAGVNTADLDIDKVSVPPHKNGILLIGVEHGNEPESAPALILAAGHFLKNVQMALNINHTAQFSVTSKRTVEQKDLLEWIANIVLFIVPVVNLSGFHEKNYVLFKGGRNRWNSNDVNINRNYPTLWNGFRDGFCLDYFRGAKPTDWNCEKPGKKAGSEPETQLVMKLMEKKVEAFIDFHSGYPRQIAYPWGFWGRGQDATNRYCSPDFIFLQSAPFAPSSDPADPPYLEYMSPQTLSNLQQMGGTMRDWINGEASFSVEKYFLGQSCSRFEANGTIVDDRTGGGSVDYFLSQDPCNIVAFNVELGSQPTFAEAEKDVRLMLYAACQEVRKLKGKGRQLPRPPDWSSKNPKADMCH